MIKTYRSVSDLDLQALIDNELDWEEAKKVLQQVEGNVALKKRYDALYEQKRILQNWWRSSHRE